MAVPEFFSFLLPLLRIAADGNEHSLADMSLGAKNNNKCVSC